MLAKSYISNKSPISSLLAITATTVLAFAAVKGVQAQQADTQGTGNLTGLVVDSVSGNALRGVIVTVEGTPASGQTDLNGSYFIPRITAGSYTVTFSRDGYRTSSASDVVITAGQSTKVDFPLATAPSLATETPLIELETFTISAALLADSDIGLLSARQKSVNVSDAIGAESFSRLGVGDAAEAMSKITGASVIDGKYVVIRGLGDRYSNTLLNGVAIPSADPDRRAVQMDQFPTDALESIVTSKSFTPDQPGAFSGGSVNLKTKNFPDGFFATVGVSTAYNTNTTGKDILVIPGSSPGAFGRDASNRSFPSAARSINPPSTSRINQAIRNNATNTDSLIADFTNYNAAFNNASYLPTTKTAGPDYGFSLSVGDRLVFDNEQEFGYIFAFAYDKSYSHDDSASVGRYSIGASDPNSPNFIVGALNFNTDPSKYDYYQGYLANPTGPFGETPQFGTTISSQNVDWGLYAQVAYKFNPSNEISLRYFSNQSAEDKITRGVGEIVRSDSGRMWTAYDLLYTERNVNSTQLEGKSVFDTSDIVFDWRVSYSNSALDQPDYRSFFYVWNFNSQQFASANGSNLRLWRELEDDSKEGAFNLTFPIDSLDGNIKVGALVSTGGREYRGDSLRWANNILSEAALASFPSPVGILAVGDRSATFGNHLITTSLADPDYDATQDISAAYAMSELRVLNSMKIIFGVRAEKTDIVTTPFSILANPGSIEQTDFLPAFAAVYELKEDMNLRFAYGKTLARPTYKELTDIRTYDAFLDINYVGNSSLQMSKIDNFDLRWEWFPRANEIIAATIFYKDLKNPIEVIFDETLGAIQPQNRDSGKVYGIEFEFRQDLSNYLDSLEGFSVGLNLAFIESEIEISAPELAQLRAYFPDIADTREFVGQAPYTLNTDLTYSNYDWGSTFTLAYNVVGKTLSYVNYGALPDPYDQPFNSLDFIYSQRFYTHFQLKLKIANLLDSEKERSIEHNGQTYFYELLNPGRTISLSLSYDF